MKKIKNLNKETLALVWKEDNLFVAKSIGVEIASQGKTKKEALANLEEALELYFEKELLSSKLSPYEDLSLEKLNISYA